MLVITSMVLLSIVAADPNKTIPVTIAAQAQNQLTTPKTNFTNITKISETVGKSSDATESTVADVTTTMESYLNSTVSACDSNDTECNVTTISPIRNDTKTNRTANEKNKNLPTKIERDTNICTCNLQAHYCDINCCCDPNCSPNDKKIFAYCKMDENRFYDSRYCNYIKYIYVNNTPFEWEVNQDGLFCVISSNKPDTYLIQNEEPLSFDETVKFQKHFWSQETDIFLDGEFQSHYGFEDSIMIIRDDSSIDYFRLTKSILTSPCAFDEDVYYLKDVKNSCSQTNIDGENVKLNFSSFFENFKIVGSPKLFNRTKLKKNIYKSCPKNICLEIEPKLCDIHLGNCIDVGQNTNLTFHCTYDLQRNLNTCHHAVKKIHYKFYHNGTQGLLKVEVLGALKNFSYHFGGNQFEFDQDFLAEFLWINQEKNHSQIFSGNPGYLPGKPVLFGIKTHNESSIKRNSSSFLDNFLVLPANVDGACVRNDTFNTPLEFEYNIIAKCTLQGKLAFKNSTNASDMCRGLQGEIFELWGTKEEKNKSLFVGVFGNANASNMLDWTPVLYKTEPKKFLNTTQGAFIDRNRTLVCGNISTLLSVEVFYSRVDLKTILNQPKIVGLSFSFYNVRDYRFSLTKLSNISTLDFSLGLRSQVSFSDVTTDKLRKYVDPPSFDIRLPYDFFYPFIRVGNSVCLVMPHNVVMVGLFLYSRFLV